MFVYFGCANGWCTCRCVCVCEFVRKCEWKRVQRTRENGAVGLERRPSLLVADTVDQAAGKDHAQQLRTEKMTKIEYV